MKDQAIPYEKWPAWVKFFIIPSGYRIWGRVGSFYQPFLFYLAFIMIGRPMMMVFKLVGFC
ncbi:MAG: hypothetical protein IPM48_01880 [Saprospiraceae bacterium]|nr:hypothetical protein [Saprospiraceae bacterium]